MTNLSFFISFTVDIVGTARATEDPHNICLSEPVTPIMKFPTRVLIVYHVEWSMISK